MKKGVRDGHRAIGYRALKCPVASPGGKRRRVGVFTPDLVKLIKKYRYRFRINKKKGDKIIREKIAIA
ncbi:hypothetical protein [Photorhabdus sp. RM323S]|uniref:hypothetical protein n=1 Tax=Photorhabdus sp. RM323S TaxID=3342828 RepID=UPI0036D9B3A0